MPNHTRSATERPSQEALTTNEGHARVSSVRTSLSTRDSPHALLPEPLSDFPLHFAFPPACTLLALETVSMRRAYGLVLGVALLGGCEEKEHTLVLETSASIEVSEQARMRWTLFGADVNVADAEGSTIAEGSESIDAFPVSVKLRFPAKPHELIDQGSGTTSKRDATFWIYVTVDLDGDGRVCPGDLYEDFEGRDKEFFDEEVPRRITVPMAVVPEDFPCED